MRSQVLFYGLAALISSNALPAHAAGELVDSYHVTALEKAACGYDAYRLCASAYPDEHKLLVCMKSNRDALGSTCRPVFEAGLKRRHL